MHKPLLVANWKMNGDLDLLKQMQKALQAPFSKDLKIALCPPFVLLPSTQALFAKTQIAYGAQDVSNYEVGAYTGQICAKMLTQLGCTYVIIGHSERRQYCGETDALIAAKALRAIEAGLIPILCIGENAQQKQQGETQAVVALQVNTVLKSLNTDSLAKLVIAYEPVWAIGTGQAADPQVANEVHGLIRATVAQYSATAAQSVHILYGGSVNADNIREFLLQPHIDGALIGGAALKPAGLMQIIHSVSEA